MLIGFFVCCPINGSGGAWIYYYISVLVFGFIVNWYVFLVTLFWPVFLVFILVAIALFLAIMLFIFGFLQNAWYSMFIVMF